MADTKRVLTIRSVTDRKQQGNQLPKHQSVELPKPSLPALSLTEALQALDYLGKKNVLCHHCGYRLVEWESPLHGHCEPCTKEGQNGSMTYTKTFRRVNLFERILCKRIEGFVQQYISSGFGQ